MNDKQSEKKVDFDLEKVASQASQIKEKKKKSSRKVIIDEDKEDTVSVTSLRQ
jgi:hypothetical protein